MSEDLGTRIALEKAIKLMDRKLDELTRADSIDAKEVLGLTQIASCLSRIDKQIKDYPEDDPYQSMSQEELERLAKDIVRKNESTKTNPAT